MKQRLTALAAALLAAIASLTAGNTPASKDNPLVAMICDGKPDSAFCAVPPGGRLSREQATLDIDALLYTISQVHPDIFSVCRQEDLLRAANKARESLPDSVTPMELYRAAAPVVALIGDGHTNLHFPFNSVFDGTRRRLPVFGDVASDRTFTCTSSLDSIIPRGARTLSINSVPMTEMLDSMLPYVSGERPHFRLSRIDDAFSALFEMLYAADNYDVEYLPQGAVEPLRHTFPATLWADIKRRCPSTRRPVKDDDYSFTADSTAGVAVMDFHRFRDPERMQRFADSMFTVLKEKEIGNLIIDMRHNGGGNSAVGDPLMRYISPEPFNIVDKIMVRVTPTVCRLMGIPQEIPGYIFYETGPDDLMSPLTPAQGHYDGKVWLLTSNNTFSSASSFAWAFKEYGMGTVIGEETGGMNVSYGDILSYRLPVSGMLCTISYRRFWHTNADENDIHGTIPHIAVPAASALDHTLSLIKNRD